MAARIFDVRSWNCVHAYIQDKPMCDIITFLWRNSEISCICGLTSARASLNDSGESIVIANPLAGFTLYNVQTGDLVRAFGHDIGQERATSVKLIERGTAIVGGSTIGAVNIWDIETGRKVQTLIHGGERLRIS